MLLLHSSGKVTTPLINCPQGIIHENYKWQKQKDRGAWDEAEKKDGYAKF